MNLILRLIKTVLLGLLGQRIGVLEPSVLSFRVWPNDLDANLHMNNGRYLTVMDLGRVDLMLRSGLARVVLRRRWMPVLASATIRFRRSLAPFQKFRLRTRLVGWDEKWLFMEQTFETMDGHVAARALVKGAFRTRRGTVPTEEVTVAVGVRSASPPLPRHVVDWLEAEESLRTGARSAA